jgi:cell division protein FtsI (penicillin-binding protein 3)
MKNSNSRSTRVAVLFTVVVSTLMGASIYKIITLKTSPPAQLVAATIPVSSTSKQIAVRGRLLDRQGRILAASRVGFKLFVDPSIVKDIESLSFKLSNIIDASPAEIEQQLRARPNARYVVLQQLLTDTQIDSIKNLSIRGVGLEERLVREYPHGDVGGALIGLVGTEHTGLAGFENKYNTTLTGESGQFVRARDVKRKTVWISPDDFKLKSDGNDVQLSIDVVIQDIAASRLREEVERCNAGGGRIVVVTPETGEIVAMADILNPRDGWSQQPEDPNRALDARLGRNRCVTDPYEPGSTFKPFIWSVATQLGLAITDEVLQTPASGPYKTSFGRSIRDASYYGPSTWEKVLIKSMNSGMAIVSQRMSHMQLQDAVRRFGFGERTHVGLGGETKGIMTSPSKWSDYTQTSVSMGHEIAVTPLQMVQGFCAFARDGTVPQLQLKLATNDDVMFVREAITPEIAALTRQIMGKVMTEGTGRKCESKKYKLFGKSGTAQLPRADGKGYFEDRYIASFIAGAPIDDPKLIVLCVIDDPDKTIGHYGGTVAGPVVRDVMEQSLEYLQVPPSIDYLAQASE